MTKDRFLKSSLISFLLFLCSILLVPAEVSAATENVENGSIQFTQEELAYCERAGEITIGCPIMNAPMLFEDEKTGRLEGITIDLLNMISEATDLTFRYQALPPAVLPTRICGGFRWT